MICIEKDVTIILNKEDSKLFSLLCKMFTPDTSTRLTDEQRSAAKKFAEKCNSVNDIWNA